MHLLLMIGALLALSACTRPRLARRNPLVIPARAHALKIGTVLAIVVASAAHGVVLAVPRPHAMKTGPGHEHRQNRGFRSCVAHLARRKELWATIG